MIRLQNVAKVYDGSTVAVRGVTLDISRGEFVFLVGPSGSGKSTLIRLIMREEMPTSGDIWVAGKHASRLASWKIPHMRRSIGTVFQDFKLLPNKTVYENVAFALEVTGKPRAVIHTQVPQVLKLVGLSAKANRYPRQLSGGEQQRVSLARAFVNRPLIVLADEPTGNLDPATSVGIMRILDRINRTGTTVVMATHDHAIVDAMRRRVVQLDQGEVVRDESRGVYGRSHQDDESEASLEESQISSSLTAPLASPDAPQSPEVEVAVNMASAEDSPGEPGAGTDPAPTAEFEVWTEPLPKDQPVENDDPDPEDGS
jgi:cell division transport system ATP-binding protein